MRKPIMGIDLGTTNCCVAIPSDEGGETVIVVVTDSFGRPTIPSVVYKTEKGEYLVGNLAKQKMGTKPPPVAFIKRLMGKETKVELRDEMLSPEEVSAKILSYLKALVKERLGDDIHQAVITIPARFELPGQQATVEAARLAGLEVLTTMPEPVAAALAYGLQDAADNLRVFCYDLGGGTFDATVMIKNPESGIEVLAFDGDPQLGGYNFDTILAKWILKELSKYSLNLDWDNPDDLVIFQKLLSIAEKAKIELSEEPEYLISKKEIFEDHNGEPVDIELTVNRTQYEEMIRPLIEETLEISERAIAKAGLTAADIDRVILVGGSSRLPMVARLLGERLACSPELADPDKIVARGAAIKASSMVGNKVEGLIFLTEIPKTCAIDSFDIHGQVTLSEKAGLTVHLHREDGGYQEKTVTANDGKFSFTNVELMEDEVNNFEITVGNIESPLLPAYRIEVEQSSDALAAGARFVPTDTNPVTQNISLLLATGLKHIFQEGTNIPAEQSVTLGTVFDDQTFAKFEVFQGNIPLGEVRIENLPGGLSKGSEVLVMMAISNDLTISGQAVMVKTNQTVDFSFKIPKPPLPSEDELRRKFALQKNDFAEAVETLNDNTLKMKNWGEGQRHIRGIEAALGNPPLDRPKIVRLVDELSMFIGSLGRIDVLEPSWEAFQSDLDDALDSAKSAEENFEKARRSRFVDGLKGVETFGTQAYQQRDKDGWQHANQQLERIKKQIEDVVQEGARAGLRDLIQSIPPEQRAAMFKEHLQQLLLALDGKIDSNPQRFQRHKPKISELISMLNRMNPNQPDQAIEVGRQISTSIEELGKLLDFKDGELQIQPR